MAGGTLDFTHFCLAVRRLTEKTGEQGDKGHADEGHAAACHELSHIQLNVKRAPKVFFGGKRKAQARCESVLID